MNINIGAGNDVIPGFVNLDIHPLHPDVQEIDLEKAELPFKDGEVDFIKAHHILEHINNLIPLMNECYRVTKKGGVMEIEVPRFPDDNAIKDPTHVRFFVPESFEYFVNDKTTEMYKIDRWSGIRFEVTLDNIIKLKLIK